jgi:dipeptidyl aminopeptidase/acylaminoacyl peptidase
VSSRFLVLSFSSARTFSLDPNTYELFRLASLDLQTGATQVVMPDRRARDSSFVGLEAVGPAEHDVVVSWALFDETRSRQNMDTRLRQQDETSSIRIAVSRFNLASGSSRILTYGEYNTIDFVFDSNVEPRYRLDVDESMGTASIHSASGGRWQRMVAMDDVIGSPISLGGILENGELLAIDTTGDNDSLPRRMAPTDGTLRDFPEGGTRPVAAVRRDLRTGRPVALVHDSLEPSSIWLDPALAALQRRLARAFPGRYVAIDDYSQDRSKVIVSVDDPSGYPARYLFDATTGQASPVGNEVPGFAGHAFARRSISRFNARDGLEIAVIVTNPSTTGGQRQPAIVFPHGGPTANDSPGYDALAQFLASRGYLVLQPQFRGSTGFGRAFEEAGTGEWGGKMQDDLTDSVAWAVAQGLADPARVGIVGASYGGYAALAGAVFTPDLYRCAISINGVSSLEGLMSGNENDGGDDRRAYWQNRMGLSRFGPEMAQRSPMNSAGRARIPILLLHGRDDTVVPVEQSRMMARELRNAGKSHELIELDGEDHWLSRRASRERVFAEMERFLGQHIMA